MLICNFKNKLWFLEFVIYETILLLLKESNMFQDESFESDIGASSSCPQSKTSKLHNQYESSNNESSNTYLDNPNLETSVVTQWLDQHPDFLTEYLRKLQQKKHLSLNNDLRGKILLNACANIKFQTHGLASEEMQHPLFHQLRPTSPSHSQS